MKCKCGGEIRESHIYWNKCTKCGELYDLEDMTKKAEALTEFKEAVKGIVDKTNTSSSKYELQNAINEYYGLTKTEGGDK